VTTRVNRDGGNDEKKGDADLAHLVVLDTDQLQLAELKHGDVPEDRHGNPSATTV
jgi:hypothetical protein